MRQLFWIIFVFALVCAWPERTAVVADAQDKQEPSKQGKGAEPAPEKHKKGDYAKSEIVGILREAEVRQSGSHNTKGYLIEKHWIVSSGKIDCYLDFQDNKSFVEFAREHQGKTVFIAGSFELREVLIYRSTSGIEIFRKAIFFHRR